MPSTWTDLDFELQAAGENTNLWGAPKLNNALSRINYAIAGYISIAITGDYSLTTVRPTTSMVAANFTSRISLLKFTGVLTANATITAAAVPMSWMVYNATNKNLVFTTGSGATVTVDSGDTIPLFSDGTNIRTFNYGGLALKDYIAATGASSGAVPSPIGNALKFLYVDSGENVIWRQPSTADLSDYNTLVLGVQVALAVAL